VLGAGDVLLARSFNGVFPVCPGPSPTVCSDGDGLHPDSYLASAGDPSFLGPLTFRYEFAPDWNKDPVSESFRLLGGIGLELTYSAVPEPGTAVLVIAGLLGLGGWRRMRD